MLVTRRYAMTALATSALTAGTTWSVSGALAAAVQTGRAAPAFTGTDTKGAEHTLAGHRARPSYWSGPTMSVPTP
jgi:hypothetical protein